jgi:NitT/TauT family transport system ATP-binding protein
MGYFDEKKEKQGVFTDIVTEVVAEPVIEKKNTYSRYLDTDIIQLRGINQVYEEKGKKNVIFDNFNLDIKDIKGQGQFTVIVGASGCGKSTLLRYIAGLQKPTSGEIFIKGKPRTNNDRVGMVFQQYSSLPWLTVLQNVALPLELQGVPKDVRENAAMEMIKIVSLEGHEHKFAQYPILSGGQLQRVAIARSLMANNEMLLLDEPFGALDIQTRLRMQDMLIKIWTEVKGDPTFLLVTHDLAEAVYLGDEIIVLDANPGRVHEIIQVKLPVERDATIKRTPKFLEYVHHLEDTMMKLNKK